MVINLCSNFHVAGFDTILYYRSLVYSEHTGVYYREMINSTGTNKDETDETMMGTVMKIRGESTNTTDCWLK
jgi:arginine deiminase